LIIAYRADPRLALRGATTTSEPGFECAFESPSIPVRVTAYRRPEPTEQASLLPDVVLCAVAIRIGLTLQARLVRGAKGRDEDAVQP
jgi:hypothetical protein